MSNKCEDLLSIVTREFCIERGHALPLGAGISRGGINFSLYSRHASRVMLLLFLPGGAEEIAAFPLDRKYNRTGDIWHIFIAGLDPGIEYAYKLDGKRLFPGSFDPDIPVADPYAKAINGPGIWGDSHNLSRDVFHRSLLVDTEYDWEFDQPLNHPLADSIIYEMHVRGFTQSETSGVTNPGTFQAIIEKILYLQTLGVTAIELLPVTEFDELDNDRHNPENNTSLRNYWGYHPLSFFAPKAAYAVSNEPGAEVREFKDMVKALHATGIEVILDVVFNHTGEGDQRGPVISFKGIDCPTYYMLNPDGSYMNFSGCGNTVNCNQPHVRELILNSLRYWVTEMHIDGFRFDLASILGRGQDGNVLSSPPLLEIIAADPVLANTKLIAEAWDAAGLYQVGSFPNWGRWAEWNGHFRDDIRDFVRGKPGMVNRLATRLAGSADLYQHEREPSHSINFVTCHDGFTLWDLVSYNGKHNRANGEGNRDGDNNNRSWNCGAEGDTDDVDIITLRKRQIRNFATLLILARGVPMILAGDECARTQGGNNNAYCQDNETSWMNWTLFESNNDLFHFFRRLIKFRKSHALLRHDSFIVRDGLGINIAWHGMTLDQPDWSENSHSLAMHLSGKTAGEPSPDIYLIANAHWEDHAFELPRLKNRSWRRFIDTALPGGSAISEPGNEPVVGNVGFYTVKQRSVVVLLST